MRYLQLRSESPGFPWYSVRAIWLVLGIPFVSYSVVTGHVHWPVTAILIAFSVPLIPKILRAHRLSLRGLSGLDIAWLLLLGAKLSVGKLATEDVLSESFGSAQLVRLGLVAVSLFIVLPYLRRWLRGEGRGLWFGGMYKMYFAFVAFAFASGFWSMGRFSTFGKVFEVVVALLVISAVSAQPDGEVRLKRLFFITIGFMALLLTTVLIGFLTNPAEFTNYIRVADEFTLGSGFLPLAPNAISRFGAVIASVAAALLLQQHRRPQHRLLALAIMILAGAFPFLAAGRTGIAALLLSLLVLVLTQRPLYSLLFLPLGGYLAAGYVDQFWEFFRRGQSLTQFAGLTGRVDWWVAGLEALSQQPLIGYGFGVGARVALISVERDASHIHNGFLEIALGTGVAGFSIWFLLLVWWLVGVGRKLVTRQDVPMASIGIPMLAATLLSQGAGGWLSIELGLFLIVMALLDRQRSLGKQRQAMYPQ